MAEPIELAERRRHLAEALARRGLPDSSILHPGDGGGTSDGMNARVTRLEEWTKVAADRLTRIETKLDGLPTKTDMMTMFLSTFAVLALVFAGLAWLDGRANRHAAGSTPAQLAPIVIQAPSPPLSPAPTK